MWSSSSSSSGSVLLWLRVELIEPEPAGNAAGLPGRTFREFLLGPGPNLARRYVGRKARLGSSEKHLRGLIDPYPRDFHRLSVRTLSSPTRWLFLQSERNFSITEPKSSDENPGSSPGDTCRKIVEIRDNGWHEHLSLDGPEE